MAYNITDDCTNCGICEPECPVDAISENDGQREIDDSMCTDCGMCAGVCPVDSINAG